MACRARSARFWISVPTVKNVACAPLDPEDVEDPRRDRVELGPSSKVRATTGAPGACGGARDVPDREGHTIRVCRCRRCLHGRIPGHAGRDHYHGQRRRSTPYPALHWTNFGTLCPFASNQRGPALLGRSEIRMRQIGAGAQAASTALRRTASASGIPSASSHGSSTTSGQTATPNSTRSW